MANPFGKAISPAKAKTDAYAVYEDKAIGWTWYILKTYQSPEGAAKNKFARAFALVVSPIVGEDGELGDVYLSQIGGRLIKGTDIRGGRALGDPLEGILP